MDVFSAFSCSLACFLNVAGSLDPHKISGSYLFTSNEMQHTNFNRVIPAVGTSWPGSHLLQACTAYAG